MLIAACLAITSLANVVGLAMIYRAMKTDPNRFEPLAPSYNSITINSDLEGLV